MKSTGTKRILSVLSAGALVATMSAIPAFAAANNPLNKDDIQLTALNTTFKATYVFEDIQWNDAKLADSLKAKLPTAINVSYHPTKEDPADTFAYDSSVTLAKDLPITGWTVSTAASGSNYNDATLTITPTITETGIDMNGVTLPSPKLILGAVPIAATGGHTKYINAQTFVTGVVTEAQGKITNVTGHKVEKVTLNGTEVAAGDQATTEVKKGDKVVIDFTFKPAAGYEGTKATYTVTIDGEKTAPADPLVSVSLPLGGKDLDTILGGLKGAIVDAKAPAGYKWKTAPTKADDVPADGTTIYLDSGCTGDTVDDKGYKDNKVPSGTYYYKASKAVLEADADNGYTGSDISAGAVVVKLTLTDGGSSDDNSSDTGNASDTAPDFTEKDMTTSTVSGNTFTHPDAGVLQNKLNNNKGTTISIGEVKSGTATIATFSMTLPKNSGNISENKVAQVINVLNTISTKSASKKAQSAVDELLKSADSKNTASMPVTFSRSMADFGMTVSVTVPVSSKFTNGGTSNFFYNADTNKLDPQKGTVTIRGGKATFDLTHASEYFLIQGVKDLSAGEGANDSEDTLSSTESTTVATSEAPVVTAPEVTQAPEVTTVPSVAANPGTGNAPIALAVIPVAVAAAAIIAKKAK